MLAPRNQICLLLAIFIGSIEAFTPDFGLCLFIFLLIHVAALAMFYQLFKFFFVR
jgi:hypothetical protein